jgi:hypothetical protein
MPTTATIASALLEAAATSDSASLEIRCQSSSVNWNPGTNEVTANG